MGNFVTAARGGFLLLGTIMACTLIYTIITDGSPFRKELLTPWMWATLVDFYFLVIILSGWIIYKEDTVLSRLIWIFLVICFGSVAACYYVAIQLFRIDVNDPVYYAILKSSHIRTSQPLSATDGYTS